MKKLPQVILAIAAVFVSAQAYATNYYVNNSTGSDSNLGTSTGAPWATFTNINSHTFLPGDTINLATGCTWNQEMDLYGSGSSGSPIVVQPYGTNSTGNQSTGAMAVISRNGASGDKCMYLHNPAYWTIQGIELTNCDDGIYVIGDSTAGSSGLDFVGLTITKCYFYLCNYDKTGQTPSTGIYLTPAATNPTTTPYLAGLQISGNLFNTCSAAVMMLGTSSTKTSFTGSVQNNYIENQPSQSYFTDSTGFLVQDNQFIHVGWWPLGTGTTTVVEAFVENFTLANNVFDTVPDTGSPDQTAVDEELSTTDSKYYGNVFVNTAGSAVEALNIHGAGTGNFNNFFDGNLFYQNGWSASGMPDAVVSYGADGANQTGTLQNNLYYEATSGGALLKIDYTGTWTQTNNIPVTNATGVYNSSVGFSGTQGANQWSEQGFAPGVGWTNLTSSGTANNTTYAWANLQYGSGSSGWITNNDLCPPASNNNWVGRVWTAPSSGVISIRGFIQNALFPGQGTPSGVKAQISLWTSSTGGETILWGGSGAVVSPTGTTNYTTDLDNVAVSAGQLLMFAVNNNGSGGNTNSAVSWIPTIYYTSGGTSSVAANAGFESPVTTNYQYGPLTNGWTFSAGSGVQKNGGAFGAPTAPDGTQTAFLQGGAPTISQAVTFSAGVYNISFKAAQRSSGSAQAIAVLIDSAQVGTWSSIPGTFTQLTTANFAVTAGSHTIEFEGLNPGDTTAFIDSVSINAQRVVSNAGFENPVTSGYTYGPSTTDWSFNAATGVAANGSGFGNPTAPESNQVGFLQGIAAVLTQTVTLNAGTYDVSFMAAQRNTGATQGLAIYIDSSLVGTWSSISQSFTLLTSNNFTVTAGNHVIKIVGLTASDATAFIDFVSVNNR